MQIMPPSRRWQLLVLYVCVCVYDRACVRPFLRVCSHRHIDRRRHLTMVHTNYKALGATLRYAMPSPNYLVARPSLAALCLLLDCWLVGWVMEYQPHSGC